MLFDFKPVKENESVNIWYETNKPKRNNEFNYSFLLFNDIVNVNAFDLSIEFLVVNVVILSSLQVILT